MKNFMIVLLLVFSFMLMANHSQAALLINEIEVNTENDGPNSSDSGKEFFEILSDLGSESLSGLTFLVIEGDGGGSGTIDKALSLDGFSTGTNGLFLWRDDSAVLLPAPDAATVINVADFDPDLENGSNTFALVRGFTGLEGDDLDTDDDGTIDVALPWSSVLDAVSAKDSGSSDNGYAAAMLAGGIDFPNISFAADSLIRLTTGQWIAADIDEANSDYPGPYPLDDTQAIFSDGTALVPSTALTFNTLSPGSANPALVPEPASLVLMCLSGLLAVAGLRRRQS
ncbi:hypothetical protein Pla144_32950 [Bythopirellula polymerisocia]|uniref:Ice-binding protein C-terminal domain-containing protein n=2 Tax=Bythopirellula polymerisocia TaxID=2528003 RepID=A0A5C6CNW4_9BACT|nr:hypothetical protein Pla144_32950 [Bythopirellula polymerisocia]